MKSYFVRIQLNTINGASPSVAVYNRLHALMEQAGASRTITGSARGYPETYDLPHAEYALDIAMDYVAVRDAVANVVTSIWSSNDVLVIEWVNCAWKLNKHQHKLTSASTTLRIGQ